MSFSRLTTIVASCGTAAIALLPLRSAAHADRIEDRLLSHFATGTHAIADHQWSDVSGNLKVRVYGDPALSPLGPAQGLILDGFGDWIEIAADRAAATPLLPKREMSVAAWVLIDETQPDGGVLGFVQDNGNFEKGWVLGFNRRVFTFSLASAGADDGDGALTRIAGKTPIEPGRWHYVVGTYDGTSMRLYVDGKEDAVSTAQSGDILYPEQGRYALGGFVDDNEKHLLQGAVQEVKTYARVMGWEEIAGIAQRNAPLLAWRSPVNTELKFVVRPYLQFATEDRITIMAETSAPSTMKVEFGEQQPLKARVESQTAAAISEVTLTGLKRFTPYYYRVICTDAAGNIARSEIQTFQTFPGPDQAWAFGILGDTQRNPDITRRCAEGIFALRPNLMIHCGDVVDDGFAKQQWVFDLFAPSANLFAHVPAFPVIGNHEKNSHWYYDYFSLPKPEYYYTFTVGNAQFFMIDSNKDLSPGSEQYVWLDQALRASKATWKFTAHHHPCFSSDEDDYGDRWKGRPREGAVQGDLNARKLVPLYEKHGVDIAFAGHIHSYERTWPILNMTINQSKGVRYVVSGGAGGGLEQAAPQRAWFSLHVARGHHYCFATVHDRTIQFKAYDVDGRLFDTFELTKPR